MKTILIILCITLVSCYPCKFPTEKVIEKHYKKKPFTSSKPKPDSCTKVWMLWVAKKS